MQVGMAVYRHNVLLWSDTGISKVGTKPLLSPVVDFPSSVFKVEDPKLVEIFGPRESVGIYTGEITEVVPVVDGGQWFQHSINSHLGCSGAIVFLLDYGNDGLVDPCNFGKAVGVHTGGVSDTFERFWKPEGVPIINIGFCPK